MKKHLTIIKDHLMTGISYALPVIIGGALVIALAKFTGLAFGYSDLSQFADKTGFLHYVYLFENVGWAGIILLNTVLGGYIAFSIAGKPGLAAGFIGGYVASDFNAGFVGALIAGFAGGYLAKWVKDHIRVNGVASSAVPLIISPLITVGLTAVLMVLLGQPLGWLNETLLHWVEQMVENDTNKIVLALILGGMIGVDLGGPINKASWGAATALLMSGIYMPSIMVNVAIPVPTLGYGIATLLKKKNFSDEFLEAGKGNIFMAICGITEGAIPFTLKKPTYLVPLNIISCAIGSATAVALGVYDKMLPVGGMYGYFTYGNFWAAFVGVFAGALVLAVGANLLCDFRDEEHHLGIEQEKETVSFDEIEINFDEL